MKWTTWFALLSLAPPGISQLTVDERVGNTVQRMMITPAESFNTPSIVALCKKFIAEQTAPLSKLIVASTKSDLLSMRGHKATHTAYQSWFLEFVEQRASVGPAAELIVLNHRATLRIQDKVRHLTTLVVGRGDALKLDGEGIVFDLLDFSARKLPGPVARVAPEGQVFEFYFSTQGTLSRGRVEALTLKIMNTLGLTGVTVEARNDTWFVEDTTFPTYYRFSTSEAVPTLEQYRAGRQVTCLSNGRSKVLCY